MEDKVLLHYNNRHRKSKKTKSLCKKNIGVIHCLNKNALIKSKQMKIFIELLVQFLSFHQLIYLILVHQVQEEYFSHLFHLLILIED